MSAPQADSPTERARRLLDAITPGPWDFAGGDPWMIAVAADLEGEGPINEVGNVYADSDAEFIAAAPDLVRDLLAERDAFHAQAVEAINLLAQAVGELAIRDEDASRLRYAIRRFARWMDIDPDWPGYAEALTDEFGSDADEMDKAILAALGVEPRETR